MDRNKNMIPAARGKRMFFDKTNLIFIYNLPSNPGKYNPRVHDNLHGSNNIISCRISQPSICIPSCLNIRINQAFTIIKGNIKNSIDCVPDNKT